VPPEFARQRGLTSGSYRSLPQHFSSTGVVEFGWLTPARNGDCGSVRMIALLVAMFPANVHAARVGVVVAGRRAMPIVWRAPLQLFWILALWWVAQSTPITR